MKKISEKLNRLESIHYRIIILFQLAVIVLLLNVVFTRTDFTKVEVQGSSLSEQYLPEVRTCLLYPSDQRATCANALGIKIASEIEDPKERIKACLLFRPHFLVNDCQKGLINQ